MGTNADFDRLTEALRVKASGPGECPACGNGLWGYPDAHLSLQVVDGTGESVDAEDRTTFKESGPVVDDASMWPLTCLKCGFVRMFHVDTLLREWEEIEGKKPDVAG
jgi:hypothetical protein